LNISNEAKFAVEGAKIGTVLNVRKPPQYTVSTGQALDLQAAKETSVPVTLTTQNHVDFQFNSADLALSVDDFSKRFISPAVAALANKIDYNGLQLYKDVFQHVGTPKTTPTSLLTYLSAGVKLDNSCCPIDGERYVVITPLMQATMVSNLTTVFNPQTVISSQYRTGEMGQAVGFTWSMDQNVPTHLTGNAVGTPVTNSPTSTGGASIITNGWTTTTATLKRGDVISVADLYWVNPQSKASTGSLAQFVVTADKTADGSGNITIPVSPTIVLSGAEQNCYSSTGAMVSGKAITVFETAQAGLAALASSSTPQGLAFHRDAFTLACADLPLPGGVDMASRVSDPDLGLSIRLVRQYDISTDNFPCRLDILYGWSTLRPELACRISA